jgi:NADH-quinone oxidoreductase subunit M
MFPFHTWLPDAHTEAPTAGSVILAAVLLKMGTYGFVRFSLPMFPEASRNPRVVGVMVGLAIVGIVYGAMVTLVQKDMKKLIAYSSVSHLGFVMLGIFALNMAGVQGGVLQMINHGISTGALFLLVGIVYERRHTRMIAEYGGLARQMPIYATYFLIMALSSMGLPILNGFIGEFTILQGAFAKNFWWAFFAATGIVLGAAYLLWLYQRIFFGEITNPANAKLADLTLREQLTLAPLVVLALWIGLYPKPIFDVIRRPSEKIVRAVGGAVLEAPALALKSTAPLPSETGEPAAAARP